MIYSEWLTQASQVLMGSDNPKREAELLLSFVTGKSRTFLMAFNETELTDKQQHELVHYLDRRKKGEPIAYIIGCKEFWSLLFFVSPATLIPRPDTEKLVELALEHLPSSSCHILELGTGTGAIAIALASERPDCTFIGVDYQAEAIELAKKNVKFHGIKNIFFLHGDWFKPIKKQKFSMIISNPPYIDKDDPHLLKGDVRFEPKSALVAKENGLSEIKHIIKKSCQYLEQYGWLLIEHGWTQGEDVRRLFKQQGFELVETYQDYGGNDRVTLGRYFTS